MVKRSRMDLRPGKIGDNAAVLIPTIDRVRGEPRSTLCIVIECNVINLYTIAVRSGILKNEYPRNEFDLCPQILLTTEA